MILHNNTPIHVQTLMIETQSSLNCPGVSLYQRTGRCVRLDRGSVVKRAPVSSVQDHDALVGKRVGLHKVSSDCDGSIAKSPPLIYTIHFDTAHRRALEATSAFRAVQPCRAIPCADLRAPHTMFQMPNLAALYVPSSGFYP
jgi:hypothetical protein